MKLKWPGDWFTEEEKDQTPTRHDRFVKELLKARDFKFTTFDNPGYDQLIMLKDIDFASLCSHHLLPFTGKAHVGYLPDKEALRNLEAGEDRR